jgi:hypothetical protein
MGHDARRFAAAALLGAAALAPAAGEAAVAIVEIYSSPDGEYQAILLEDDANDGVERFRGLTFVVEDAQGRSRTFTLTGNRIVESAIVVDGRRRFLVATRSLALWLRAQAAMPDAFLETGGGALAIFGASPQRYPALDDDGPVAFGHDGTALRSNLALAQHPKALPDDPAGPNEFFATPVPAPLAREYHDARNDRYRLAVTQPEKAALDRGEIPGWERTGRYFRTLDPLASAAVPVCRYRLPPPYGDAPFYSASGDECAAVAHIAGAVLEAPDAFYAALPDAATGLCPPATTLAPHVPLLPVYRSWNARAGGNHRYTTDVHEREDMLARGWLAEGEGPLGVAMCVDAFDFGVTMVPKGTKPPVCSATC